MGTVPPGAIERARRRKQAERDECPTCAAAEEKGRSEERERLRVALGRLAAGFDREYALAESMLTRTIAAHKAKGVQAAIDALAALDSDQEAGNG